MSTTTKAKKIKTVKTAEKAAVVAVKKIAASKVKEIKSDAPRPRGRPKKIIDAVKSVAKNIKKIDAAKATPKPRGRPKKAPCACGPKKESCACKPKAKPVTKKVYCGIGELAPGYRYGKYPECMAMNQIRLYGKRRIPKAKTTK